MIAKDTECDQYEIKDEKILEYVNQIWQEIIK